jgi:hypothetical protein
MFRELEAKVLAYGMIAFLSLSLLYFSYFFSFLAGLKFLIIIIIIFFIIFSFACYFWSRKDYELAEKIIIGLTTSFLYSSFFFLAGIGILGLIFLFFKYLSIFPKSHLF